MSDISFNDRIMDIVHMPEDGRIMVSDPFNQFAVGRIFHSAAFIKKAGDFESPA